MTSDITRSIIEWSFAIIMAAGAVGAIAGVAMWMRMAWALVSEEVRKLRITRR